MHGFGPIVREEGEPYFHAAWEKSALALHMLAIAQGISGTLDSNRHGIERMGNVPYVSTSYYEHWIAGTERRLIEDQAGIGRSVSTRFARKGVSPTSGRC